ncbi:MAG: stress response translation initiation inhibitor YciH [Candidatus Woesearchaeota archaeon]
MTDICEICGLPKDLCVCGSIAKEDVQLKVYAEQRKFRKEVTIIEGLAENKEVDVEELLRFLKKRLGCGGVIRENNVIELQGNHLTNIKKLLIEFGFNERNISLKK